MQLLKAEIVLQPDKFSFAANLDLMENRNNPVKQFVLYIK
jgi:hypothetical protein